MQKLLSVGCCVDGNERQTAEKSPTACRFFSNIFVTVQRVSTGGFPWISAPRWETAEYVPPSLVRVHSMGAGPAMDDSHLLRHIRVFFIGLHGIGLGTGPEVEGWLEDVVAFRETQR